MSPAGHREPYESRGSRTVLGARGGEIPPRDSTTPPILVHHSKLAGQTAAQLSRHRRTDRRDDDPNRLDGSMRTRHQSLSQRDRRVGREMKGLNIPISSPSTSTANGTTRSRH